MNYRYFNPFTWVGLIIGFIFGGVMFGVEQAFKIIQKEEL